MGPQDILAALQRRIAHRWLRSLPAEAAVEVLSEHVRRLPCAAMTAAIEEAFGRLSAFEALEVKARLTVVEKLDYTGGDILLTMRAPGEYARRLACQKEPWTVRWIEACINPGDVLFDVGANVGAYSLVAAKHTSAKARIFALEPAFANYLSLCENIVLNGYEECITPLPLALSDRHHVDYFNYARLDAGAALHTLGEQRDYRGQAFEAVYRQPVVAYGIDQLVELLDFPLPNHIKIDVDGTEMDVLRGAERTLGNRAVSSMMIESCELRVPSAAISDFLASKGWRLANRYDREDQKGRSLGVSYLEFSRNP